MHVFESTIFQDYIQARLDQKTSKFKKDEREIDWKIAYEQGIKRSRREWAERWGCSVGAAQKTIKPLEELVAKYAIGLVERGMKLNPLDGVHPEENVNAKMNTKVNAEPAILTENQTITGSEVNVHMNEETNEGEDLPYTSRASERDSSSLRSEDIITHFVRNNVVPGEIPFSVDDVEKHLLNIGKQFRKFRTAIDAAGISIRELSEDIWCYYGAHDWKTKTGNKVTAKTCTGRSEADGSTRR